MTTMNVKRAAAAALNVHPGRNPDQPQEVMDLIRSERGDPPPPTMIRGRGPAGPMYFFYNSLYRWAIYL